MSCFARVQPDAEGQEGHRRLHPEVLSAIQHSGRCRSQRQCVRVRVRVWVRARICVFLNGTGYRQNHLYALYVMKHKHNEPPFTYHLG